MREVSFVWQVISLHTHTHTDANTVDGLVLLFGENPQAVA